MALGWKLVTDAADPYRQAVFWAAALEYEIEDNSVLIGKLLGNGMIDESVLAEADERRYFRDAVAVRHPDDPFDEETGIGHGRRLLFQRVPEAEQRLAEGTERPKNPLHIDVHADPGQREATVAKLESLGGTVQRHVTEPQGEWTVLEDPEGNVFCVA